MDPALLMGEFVSSTRAARARVIESSQGEARIGSELAFPHQYARVRHGLIPGKAKNEKTALRSEDAAGTSLSGGGNLEHPHPEIYPLQKSRWNEHRTEDGGRSRTHPAGGDEARQVLEATKSGRLTKRQ